jgi:hypothetical protein
MSIDYSTRDNDGKTTFYVLLWKRHGIPLELFDNYWRDVHGPVCARLPGQFQYWQWHVAHNQGGIFPQVKGVNYSSTEQEQFDGIAELTFRSVPDRQRWMTASAILMDDEHNIFSKAIGYITDEGNSRTWVDRAEIGDPNGGQGLIKHHVMLRQAQGITVMDFRKYLTDVFATALVQNPRVSKFRLHMFEPPDLSRPEAAGVAHAEPSDMLYQAAFEIGFRNHLDMETFFSSADYTAAVESLAKYVKQLSPFPERASYTFVYGARMTLAGQRGSRAAELITQLGAINQIRDNIGQLLGIREPNT